MSLNNTAAQTAPCKPTFCLDVPAPDFKPIQALILMVPAREQQTVPTWMRRPLSPSRVRPSKKAGPGRDMPGPPLKVSCRPRSARLGREDSCASPGGSGLELRTGAGSVGAFGSALLAGEHTRGGAHCQWLYASRLGWHQLSVHLPSNHTCICATFPGSAGRRLSPAQGRPNAPRCRVSRDDELVSSWVAAPKQRVISSAKQPPTHVPANGPPFHPPT